MNINKEKVIIMETDFKITAPVLDMNVIQKAAQDAAMKAALEEVKDYYLRYDSPYRKQLKEYMAKNAPSTRLELPEFSELLSKSLSSEIENIVNKKCVESFAQELRKGFTHLKEECDGTILLTNLAEDMMYKVDLEDADSNNSFELEVSDTDFSSWKKVHISIWEDDEHTVYDFTLAQNGSDGTYSIVGMPTKDSDEEYHVDTIKIKNRKGTISFPMFSGVSNDYILLVLARCIMFEARIRIDSNYIIKKSNEFEDD